MLRVITYALYASAKYETFFQMNEIDSDDLSNEMAQKYHRLKEIMQECLEKKLSEEEADKLFGDEVHDLHYAIKRREFVCKVDRVAYLGGMKMLAEFWGEYYALIDFEKVLELPEVQERYPDFERLKEPEVFQKVFPYEYHVFFGEQPNRVDVTSHFIWHFGKRVKEQINVEDYNWIRGY